MTVFTPLSNTQKLEWLRLIRTEGIGPITFHHLLRKYRTSSDAIKALKTEASHPDRRRSVRIPTEDQCLEEIRAAQKTGARIVAFCEPGYPAALRDLHDAPPILWTLGDVALLKHQTIALVGARNCSAAGLKMARILGRELGEAGFVVTSGLARGVDGAAHKASLTTGTIAVVGGGVDIMYPPEHRELGQKIAGQGCIISEMPMGHQARGKDFPRRNRIISGLSLAVIVVEAAAKSGSLITARFAAEQGRHVLAVPGSPLDPRAEGTNALIREGATLVSSAQDVLEEIHHLSGGIREPVIVPPYEAAPPPPPLSAGALEIAKNAILTLLGQAPVHRDDIVRLSERDIQEVHEALLDLVLDGQAEELPSGYFTRRMPEPG